MASKVLCVAFVIHLLLLQDSHPCEMWEYSIGGECCPKCDAGHRVSRHCTTSSSTSCVHCNQGWYTEHPNGLTMCFKCQECDPGAHMQIKRPCHYRKNTECTCLPGFYCSHRLEGGSCDLCAKHTVAPPGCKVIEHGTENEDTKFESCPPGTFSATEMSSFCTKWTNCSKEGLIEKQAGSTTADVVCGVHNAPPVSTAVIVPVTLSILFVVLGLMLWLIWKTTKKYRKKVNCRKKGKEPHRTNPENEHMVTPIQETTQNLGQPTYARC